MILFAFAKQFPILYVVLSTTTAYDRAVRMKKRRTELAQVKRENNEYLLRVERAKVQRILKERKVRVHLISLPNFLNKNTF